MIQKNIQVRSLDLNLGKTDPKLINTETMSICCLRCDARFSCSQFDESNEFNMSEESPLQNQFIALCMTEKNGYLIFEDQDD